MSGVSISQTYVKIVDGRIRPVKLEFKDQGPENLYRLTESSLFMVQMDSTALERAVEGKLMQVLVRKDSILGRLTTSANYRYDLKFNVTLRVQKEVLVIQFREMSFKRSDRYWQKLVLKSFNPSNPDEKKFLDVVEGALDDWVFDLQDQIRKRMNPSDAPAGISN